MSFHFPTLDSLSPSSQRPERIRFGEPPASVVPVRGVPTSLRSSPGSYRIYPGNRLVQFVRPGGQAPCPGLKFSPNFSVV